MKAPAVICMFFINMYSTINCLSHLQVEIYNQLSLNHPIRKNLSFTFLGQISTLYNSIKSHVLIASLS